MHEEKRDEEKYGRYVLARINGMQQILHVTLRFWTHMNARTHTHTHVTSEPLKASCVPLCPVTFISIDVSIMINDYTITCNSTIDASMTSWKTEQQIFQLCKYLWYATGCSDFYEVQIKGICVIQIWTFGCFCVGSLIYQNKFKLST